MLEKQTKMNNKKNQAPEISMPTSFNGNDIIIYNINNSNDFTENSTLVTLCLFFFLVIRYFLQATIMYTNTPPALLPPIQKQNKKQIILFIFKPQDFFNGNIQNRKSPMFKNSKLQRQPKSSGRNWMWFSSNLSLVSVVRREKEAGSWHNQLPLV